jgi:hypothetical protein
MHDANTIMEKLLTVFFLALPFFITPATELIAAEARIKPAAEPLTKGDFVLTVKDNLISLKAKDASLKDILEEIGRRMKIDVVATIPEKEKLTAEFEKLPLEQAVQRLSTNYSYQIDSEKSGKPITKLIVLDKEAGTVRTIADRDKDQKSAKPNEETATQQPEPFKFVIGDPEPVKKSR